MASYFRSKVYELRYITYNNEASFMIHNPSIRTVFTENTRWHSEPNLFTTNLCDLIRRNRTIGALSVQLY